MFMWDGGYLACCDEMVLAHHLIQSLPFYVLCVPIPSLHPSDFNEILFHLLVAIKTGWEHGKSS